MVAKAVIVKVQSVTNHPNADKLDVVTAGGYTIITGRGTFKSGDLRILIEPDIVIPKEKSPLLEELLKGFPDNLGRVRAIKLRGLWSEGILLPQNPFEETTREGYDLTKTLGLSAYESQAKVNTRISGAAMSTPFPYFIPKTDSERVEKFPNADLLRYDFTHKIDGCSATYYVKTAPYKPNWLARIKSLFGYKLQKYMVVDSGVCSRNCKLDKVKDKDSVYYLIDNKYKIIERLADWCIANELSIAIQGEIFGNGINASPPNKDAKEPLGFKAFSVYDINKARYTYLRDVLDTLLVPFVPYASYSPKGELTIDLLRDYTETRGVEGIVGRNTGTVDLENPMFIKIMNRVYDSKK